MSDGVCGCGSSGSFDNAIRRRQPGSFWSVAPQRRQAKW